MESSYKKANDLFDEGMESWYKKAKDLVDEGNTLEALKLIEETSSTSVVFVVQVKERLDYMEAEIFEGLGQRSSGDLKISYLLASAECFSRIGTCPQRLDKILLELEEHIGSSLYYKKPPLVVRGSNQSNLGNYWPRFTLDFKRKLMRVKVDEFMKYVQSSSGLVGLDSLVKILKQVKKDKFWTTCLCRSCDRKFSTREDVKDHIQGHAAHVPREHMPNLIGDVWVARIRSGCWEPVDVVDSVHMIKNRFEDVKAFEYEGGWCRDWRLANDEERSRLLKEIQSLLLSFIDHKLLSVSLLNMLMHLVLNKLGKLQVSSQALTDCGLVDTPQSFCFLEFDELRHALAFLQKIKLKSDDGTEMVCREVDICSQSDRVKERIDFSTDFSFLLLDKRLLRGEVESFDHEGKVKFHDPNAHYATVVPHGDYLMTWLNNRFGRLEDESFLFPKPASLHRFELWLSALRAFQFVCRKLVTEYAKKVQYLEYAEELTGARDLWNKGQHERLVSAVLDVLKGEISVDLLKRDDNAVLKYSDVLQSMLKEKIALTDSKIILIESSRINLLNQLTGLAAFDYRSYLHRPLKNFILVNLNRAVRALNRG